MTEGGQKVKKENGNNGGIPFMVLLKWVHLRSSHTGHVILFCRKEGLSNDCLKRKSESNPFLPKVTMVGVSTGGAGQLSKSSLKKTMEDLTKELEQTDEANDSAISNSSSEFKINDRDPLFVANVGDYYSEGVG
ncbi:hypothetical protein OIU76_010691 [Salix suchowensis]|nr:hypothetical protein OIU76_010691 [Salix suchowensis]